MPSWRIVAAAGAFATYAVLSHWLMLEAADRPWAIVVLLGPLLLALATLALRQRHAPTLLACALCAAAMAAYVARADRLQRAEHLYVLQHVGFHLALALGFGLTLRARAQPLVGALAARVHGTLTPTLAHYTRRLTQVWVGYFVAMALLSLALYASAPWWLWSLFANLFTPLAAAALFIGEYALRYRLHPEFERATLAQALRAYRSTPLMEAKRP
ncbi:MAG: hypothetical protein IT390_01845 [Nitrospira sp.]|nr:hypothetical protein [Nitrospira sp.]